MKLKLLTYFLLTSFFAVAQEKFDYYEISGRFTVIDSIGLDSASIEIPYLGLKTYSNDEGYYTLEVPYPLYAKKQFKILAYAKGYKSKKIMLKAPYEQNIILDFTYPKKDTTKNAIPFIRNTRLTYDIQKP